MFWHDNRNFSTDFQSLQVTANFGKKFTKSNEKDILILLPHILRNQHFYLLLGVKYKVDGSYPKPYQIYMQTCFDNLWHLKKVRGLDRERGSRRNSFIRQGGRESLSTSFIRQGGVVSYLILPLWWPVWVSLFNIAFSEGRCSRTRFHKGNTTYSKRALKPLCFPRLNPVKKQNCANL